MPVILLPGIFFNTCRGACPPKSRSVGTQEGRGVHLSIHFSTSPILRFSASRCPACPPKLEERRRMPSAALKVQGSMFKVIQLTKHILRSSEASERSRTSQVPNFPTTPLSAPDFAHLTSSYGRQAGFPSIPL